MRALLLSLVALAAAGCTDFPLPSELDHAEILALRADPPIVEAGGRSALAALVAGPDGEVTAAPAWTAVSLVPGADPVGRIEVDGAGVAWFVAPDELPSGMPTVGVAQATVAVGEGDAAVELVGVKAIGIGLPATENPAVESVSVDGEAVGDDGVMRVEAGAEPALEVTVSPPAGGQTEYEYAWFSTLGEIDPYRRAATTLAAPEEPGRGWLFVVVRDGLGGAGWRRLQVVVE